MSDKYEKWLKQVCFQNPTREAHDLAKCAWRQAEALSAAEKETLANKILEISLLNEKLENGLKAWRKMYFELYDASNKIVNAC